jgi:tRNA(Ile)-lysidine synthase
MEGHSVKLSAFFVNRKLPRAWRDRVPLLVAGGEIVWVCGQRVGEEAAVGAETRQVAKVWFECV